MSTVISQIALSKVFRNCVLEDSINAQSHRGYIACRSLDETPTHKDKLETKTLLSSFCVRYAEIPNFNTVRELFLWRKTMIDSAFDRWESI